MIARYFHILKNLPGILNRLETELQSKATKASVDTLRFTVTKKADVEFVVNLSGIINERLDTKVNANDLTALHSLLGGRLDALETKPVTDITHLVQKVRAPRKPKGPQ